MVVYVNMHSTVSSGLNSLAAITLEDFVRGICYPNISDESATKISKFLAVFFGLISFGLVFVAEQLGGVLQAALSIFGIIGGTNSNILPYHHKFNLIKRLDNI